MIRRLGSELTNMVRPATKNHDSLVFKFKVMLLVNQINEQNHKENCS